MNSVLWIRRRKVGLCKWWKGKRRRISHANHRLDWALIERHGSQSGRVALEASVCVCVSAVLRFVGGDKSDCHRCLSTVAGEDWTGLLLFFRIANPPPSCSPIIFRSDRRYFFFIFTFSFHLSLSPSLFSSLSFFPLRQIHMNRNGI